MPTDTYSISDLARLTGVNVRTIRYYLAQGLLPASGESGPGAHYGEGHLDRLRLTRRLQQQHLPLAEIRRRLGELTDAEVASVIATTIEPEQPPTTSALEYVRSALGTPLAPTAMSPAPAPAQAVARLRMPARMGMVYEQTAMHREPVAEPAPIADAAKFIVSAPRAEPTTPLTTNPEPMKTVSHFTPPERSQWERLSLGPNIELHIRRPLGRLEQRRVERFLTIARQVLKEEAP